MGKSDPYVKLKMSDNKLPSKKTTVKRSNLNPEWNEEFKFVVTDPENQALEVNVFDWEQAWLPFLFKYCCSFFCQHNYQTICFFFVIYRLGNMKRWE